MSTISPLLQIHMYKVKGSTPCFLKGLENIERVPLLFLFVSIILANCWKMVAPAKRIVFELVLEMIMLFLF